MTLDDFTRALAEIGRYLGSPLPADADVLAAWFERVERIPSEAVPYIVRRITDDAERMPKNPPKLFRALHLEWQAAHATPAAPVRQPGCRDCYDGLIWLEKPGTAETAVVICPCYRGHPGGVPRASLAVMECQGWKKRDLTGYGTANRHDQLAGQIGHAWMEYADPDHRRVDHYDDSPF